MPPDVRDHLRAAPGGGVRRAVQEGVRAVARGEGCE